MGHDHTASSYDHETADAGALPPVEFTFSTYSGWEANDWKVRAFELREEVSAPYVLQLQVITDDVDVDVDALIGAECELALDRGAGARLVPGLVTAVTTEALGPDRLGLSLTIRPALALLAHRRCSRIFHDRSVPEVVAQVIRDFLAHRGRDYRFDLDPAAYLPRPTITQSDESDLEFIQRLLADEGIHYRFEAEGGRERVVFADQSHRAPLLAGDDEGGDAALPLVTRGSGAAARESVAEFTQERAVTATSAAYRYWNHQEAAEPPIEATQGDVDDPGALALHDHRAPAPADPDVAARLARLTREAAQVEAARGRATTDAIALTCGQRFALAGHPQRGCDRGYFITGVIHRGDAPDAQAHADADARPRYRNELVCIPDTTPYRPPRPTASLRRIPPQTAIVVGPEGEEIHTDEQGRVLVRFAWDRRPPGEAQTHWIRVCQGWAGPGFGAQFIPRVGTEVMVEFLCGDPDQPVITGCLYNSHHTSPFKLPEEKSVSGLRSDSSPHGGGYNELVFDDTKGAEQVRLRAECDLVEAVSRDRHRRVGRDEKVEIGRDRRHEITGEDHLTVRGPRALTVHETMSTTVTGMYETTILQGGYYLDVRSGGIQIDAAQTIWTSTPQGYDLTADTTCILKGKAGIELSSAAGPGKLLGHGGAEVSSESGPLKLQGQTNVLLASGAGDLAITAPGELSIQSSDAVVVHGQKAIRATTLGEIAIHAAKRVTIEANESLCLKVGMSSIEITPRGIFINGPLINSTATGVHIISGSMIRLN